MAREVVTEPEESPYADDPGTSTPAKPAEPPEADKTGPVAENSHPDWH